MDNIKINENGGWYQHGKPYPWAKKMDVVLAYETLREEDPTKLPTTTSVAYHASVSEHFARKVLKEYSETGTVEDPEIKIAAMHQKRTQYTKIDAESALFLLACRLEDDQLPLYKYSQMLFIGLGVHVSTQTISTFFRKRFLFKGNLRKPNLVPLDKFKERNIDAYHTFMGIIARLPNHYKYHFIDEKHIVNKDCMGNRVRADPLTGQVRCIKVTGNFRFAYNMIAIISPNSNKVSPVHYILGEDNGNAACFTAYITLLITIGWFEHGDVLIMDNSAIHTGQASGIIKDLLWETVVNGRPLNCLVVPLPTRSPELNPIELVFHVLARRLRSHRYRVADAERMTVPFQAARVMGGMSRELILKCCGHCGY